MSPPPDPAGGDALEEPIEHPVFAALYDRVLPERILLGPHRQYLAAGLSGRVLDLGAGTGSMIDYVADDIRAGRLTYHAIEPDPYMRRRANRTAREHDLAVEIRGARAESLPYREDTFDAVISGMVFCTIADPDAALEEIARVLKPGGECRFLEHVHADGWRARGQRALNPLWERVAGGCQLTRDTVSRFAGHEAFDLIELERVSLGVFPATPFVRGRLRRRRG